MWFNDSTTQPYEHLRYSPSFDPAKGSINQDLYQRYQFLNNDTFYSLTETDAPIKLPEGAIEFRRVNRTQLDAVLGVKDVRSLMLYRATGVT